MKKFCFLIALFFSATTALAQESGLIDVYTESQEWEVSMRDDTTIRAFNAEYAVELLFNISDLLPNSPQCVSNKRIKDIKFTVNIYKTAQDGDYDWAKSFEQMRIRFSGHGKSEDRKPYGSNLVKNNLKVNRGTTVNVGTLQYLSPLTCSDIFGASFYVSDVKAGGKRPLPALQFKIISPKDNKF